MVKSWKTTVFGGLVSTYLTIHPLLITGRVDMHNCKLAIVIFIFSCLMKDCDATEVK